ncbi:cucumber peeling cupredoxin-like [Lolium rigidum]|uniref:cucumber peeling cupredoxin-like n=1 Tax=Lolium rigidum TaxID=89674 RepID=UPI001F5C9078|nr:cucumber peeling cupredoxin-like [Lolium rigidum]
MALLLRAAAVAATAAAVMGMLASPAAAQGAPSPSPDPAYRNHTVGGADGWFFNATSNSTSGNYSSWAATETFYLGDYLIFQTNDNSSVVLTTNATTYTLCDPSEDDGLETYIYSGGGGGGGGTEETKAIAAPLLYEGTNYFFSEADGGAQCQQGMRFEIKVAYGRGLPPDLAHPPPPPMERVLAPPPAGSVLSQGLDGADAGAGAGDDTDVKNAGCRAIGAGTRFLEAVAAVTLAFFVAL